MSRKKERRKRQKSRNRPRSGSDQTGSDQSRQGATETQSEGPTFDGDSSSTPRDYGFLGITGLLILVAIWLVLMPIVPSLAQTTMRRFHLSSSSFLRWAVQFPIPTMYNFSNRYQIDRYPSGLVDSLFDENEERYINHFPVRCVTFADGRYSELQPGKDRWITVKSSYRGETLESRFHARPNDAGGFDLIRLDEGGTDR